MSCLFILGSPFSVLRSSFVALRSPSLQSLFGKRVGAIHDPRRFAAGAPWGTLLARLRREYDWILLDGGPLFLGVDIGREHDLTVLWALEQIGDVFHTRALIPMLKAPFDVQEGELYRWLKLSQMRRCCIDQTGIGAHQLQIGGGQIGLDVGEQVAQERPDAGVFHHQGE